MATRRPWSYEELLVAFRLYCHAPFGQLHQHNPEIIELARLIGRTPSAVAIKACNFASLDPAQQARNIRALGNVSSTDRQFWEEFKQDSQSIASQAEEVLEQFSYKGRTRVSEDIQIPSGPSEVIRAISARRVQSFFHSAVLNSYNFRCALTGITVTRLLNASHIIP